ncbi:MAG: thioredoxin domain-containing protein, partial [Gammaproteobacteria bacterium]
MNALQNETSPYLLQHADNPVEWYPWGEEALAKAVRENKPILLSVGYSACHWCHVMAHESFEDQGTADVMNRLFVNIKVDREERPDLDKIYQTAHQLIAQRPGGWPLTMFLTPGDHLPFFGGTYFPNESRYGMPAFTDLLLQVANFFETKQDDIHRQCAGLLKALKGIDQVQQDHDQTLDRRPLDSLREHLQERFDPECGGFGGAPKFPQATS